MPSLLRWQFNPSFNPKARTLLVMVSLAGIGLMAAVIALLWLSLNLVSAKTNELDARLSTESVQAAVDTSMHMIGAVLNDNGVWDDATAHAYRPKGDPRWFYNTWGAVADDSHAYDGIYVMDENYNILWGYANGQESKGAGAGFLGTGFSALLRGHAGEIAKGGDGAVGLSRTATGPAVVGINLIRPATHALNVPVGQRRYLVMTRHITATTLGDISRTFRISDLKLTATEARMGEHLTLKGPDGQVIGALSWAPRAPGAKAAKAAQGGVWLIMAGACALLLLFSAASAFGFYKLAKSEKQARSFALTDGLSGLPNRRALFEMVQKLRAGRGDKRKTVVYLDLDGFKEVNDVYGHGTGDKLIMIVSAALKGQLPEGALLARMGGDEFAMLLGGKDALPACQAFADYALAFLSAPIRIGDRTVQVGASIGIASADLKSCTSQELFRRADMAMYHSKGNGKGRITHYDAELDAARLMKAKIEADMRVGLDRDEFDVLYQPIIDARSQTVTGVEALVRWPRRPGGALYPDQFIDIAESSGLIHQLGRFVLKRACIDLRDISDLRLSVNISPAQFRDPEFESKVAEIIEETAFPIDRLELEITEGYLIENPDRAIAAVSNLKALGVSMALDDFGTGYSSIGYLRRYNFDKVKIDKSLAGLVDTDPQAGALVVATVGIAKALNLSVTAEGVENEDQLRLLKMAGCNYLQGYYFSRPVTLEQVLKVRGALLEKAAA